MVCLRHCPLIIDHAALLPGRSHRIYEGVPTCKTQLKLNYMYYRAVRVVCLRHISSISSMIDHDLAALLSSCCHTCRALPCTRATYKAATELYPYTDFYKRTSHRLPSIPFQRQIATNIGSAIQRSTTSWYLR